uniref:Uncharacterized protein n=1 Tax=Vitis vinifera TaxID=29760 RepID=F6H747_VITVI
MASEKANARIPDSCTSSNQAALAERTTNTNSTTNSNFGKALAQRALFRSRRRLWVGGRKTTNNEAKSLPSRLSKVSLAEDSENQ